ncbi:MAG TPA: FHA domain-containing protein [Nocardioides sp.]|nr:FHA domain-containing protein [Nocardioides sp.]
MTTYVPGDFATIVTGDGVVLTAPDRLAEVVALSAVPPTTQTLVEVLSRGSLADLPEFVAVTVAGGELRVVVRGAFAVRTDGFAVDGLGAATWIETTAPLPPGSTVDVAPVGTPLAGPALPLSGGVVRSAGVHWRPGPGPARPAPGSPAEAHSQPPPVPDYTVARRRPPAGPDAATTPPMTPRSTPSVPPPAMPPGPPPAFPPPAAPPAPPAPPAAVAPPPAASGAPSAAPTGTFEVDHDGLTITPAQLEVLRARQAPQGQQAPPPPAPPSPPVQQAPAAPTVAIELSTGRVIPVRRRVLIGRSPRVRQVGSSANLPALVAVDDPYVSGTHLEISFDEGRIMATDTSTNGTLLTRAGVAPVQLPSGSPTEVAVGDVLTLSKGLTATLVPAPGS